MGVFPDCVFSPAVQRSPERLTRGSRMAEHIFLGTDRRRIPREPPDGEPSRDRLVPLILATYDLQDTIKGFKGLCEGKYDNLPEAAFYMVGPIEEAVEKGKNSRPRRPREHAGAVQLNCVPSGRARDW